MAFFSFFNNCLSFPGKKYFLKKCKILFFFPFRLLTQANYDQQLRFKVSCKNLLHGTAQLPWFFLSFQNELLTFKVKGGQPKNARCERRMLSLKKGRCVKKPLQLYEWFPCLKKLLKFGHGVIIHIEEVWLL